MRRLRNADERRHDQNDEQSAIAVAMSIADVERQHVAHMLILRARHDAAFYAALFGDRGE